MSDFIQVVKYNAVYTVPASEKEIYLNTGHLLHADWLKQQEALHKKTAATKEVVSEKPAKPAVEKMVEKEEVK